MWRLILFVAGSLGGIGCSRPPAPASVPISFSEPSEETAAVFVEQLGGTVIRDKSQAGSPVVAVTLPPGATDADLKELAPFKNLTRLDLSQAKVTDEGVVHLRKHNKLTWLVLQHTRVTGSGLKDLESLTYLSLGNTQITDAGLKEVGELKKLTYLYLVNTRITDEGVKALAALKSL